MEILITGSNGYLGSRLSFELAKKGHQITAVCHSKPSPNSEWASLMKEVLVGDIREQSFVEQISSKKTDCVIHLISLDHHQSNDDPKTVSDINVLATWTLLDRLAKNGFTGKFIYFSTIHVYGKVPNTIIDESYPTAPRSPYGLTHKLSEEICDFYKKTSNISCINVRLSNSFGNPIFVKNKCWQLVVNEFCLTALLKKEITIMSDGSPLRDFIHYSDVVKFTESILSTSPNQDSNRYNISSGETFSILEIAMKVKSVYEDRFKEKIKIYINKDQEVEVPESNSIKKYTIDNSKISAIANLELRKMESGIAELFDYLEVNKEQLKIHLDL